MDERTGNEILSLIERTKTLIISALDEDGVPIIKGVTKLGNDGYRALYFCTSPQSRFFQWYLAHPRTSAYLFDDDPNIPYPSVDEKYYSLSLMGHMEAVTDIETRRRFLSDYLADFFPDGVNDKNYHLVKFSVEKGKYYRGVTDDFLSMAFTIRQ
ncbi:MAG: pyridoxamine 5'-phosphate oxidase family protein [Christensenellales bacterium]